MTRLRTIDLDNPSHVERLWGEVERIFVLRRLDPEVRQRIVDRLPTLDDVTAAEIQAALEVTRPRAVMAAYWPKLLDPRLLDAPALGAFLRPVASRKAA